MIYNRTDPELSRSWQAYCVAYWRWLYTLFDFHSAAVRKRCAPSSIGTTAPCSHGLPSALVWIMHERWVTSDPVGFALFARITHRDRDLEPSRVTLFSFRRWQTFIAAFPGLTQQHRLMKSLSWNEFDSFIFILLFAAVRSDTIVGSNNLCHVWAFVRRGVVFKVLWRRVFPMAVGFQIAVASGTMRKKATFQNMIIQTIGSWESKHFYWGKVDG